MKKSQIPSIAKAILNKLNTCESKDVCIDVKGDNYDIYEYDEISKIEKDGIPSWMKTTMEFNYSNTPLPTQKEIENSLFKSFIEEVK